MPAAPAPPSVAPPPSGAAAARACRCWSALLVLHRNASAAHIEGGQDFPLVELRDDDVQAAAVDSLISAVAEPAHDRTRVKTCHGVQISTTHGACPAVRFRNRLRLVPALAGFGSHRRRPIVPRQAPVSWPRSSMNSLKRFRSPATRLERKPSLSPTVSAKSSGS